MDDGEGRGSVTALKRASFSRDRHRIGGALLCIIHSPDPFEDALSGPNRGIDNRQHSACVMGGKGTQERQNGHIRRCSTHHSDITAEYRETSSMQASDAFFLSVLSDR